jgi:hypothetical protein
MCKLGKLQASKASAQHVRFALVSRRNQAVRNDRDGPDANILRTADWLHGARRTHQNCERINSKLGNEVATEQG